MHRQETFDTPARIAPTPDMRHHSRHGGRLARGSGPPGARSATMTAINRLDAQALDEAFERALAAPDAQTVGARLRSLFVERLDFDPATGTVPLRAEALPETAERIAQRDG